MISSVALVSTFVIAGTSIVLGFIVGRAVGKAESTPEQAIQDNNSNDNTSIALNSKPEDVAATGS